MIGITFAVAVIVLFLFNIPFNVILWILTKEEQGLFDDNGLPLFLAFIHTVALLVTAIAGMQYALQ